MSTSSCNNVMEYLLFFSGHVPTATIIMLKSTSVNSFEAVAISLWISEFILETVEFSGIDYIAKLFFRIFRRNVCRNTLFMWIQFCVNQMFGYNTVTHWIIWEEIVFPSIQCSAYCYQKEWKNIRVKLKLKIIPIQYLYFHWSRTNICHFSNICTVMYFWYRSTRFFLPKEKIFDFSRSHDCSACLEWHGT